MLQDGIVGKQENAVFRILIDELLEQIQDERFLRRIYIMVSDYVKEKPE